MKRNTLERRLEYMFSHLRAEMVERMEKVMDSGCVDIEAAHNDYTLPNIVFTAVLKAEAEKYLNDNTVVRKEINNAYIFS